MEYTFTLKYQLSAADCNHDELVERLGAAGCDDALIGVGQVRRIALEFTRESGNAEAALLSALADIKRAIPSAKLIEAAPDFVGLTDVAELLGVSRQNMRKLMVNNASFPAPIHDGNVAIWHLADVLAWLIWKGGYQLEQASVAVARAAKQINLAREAGQLAPDMQREVQALFA
ncbi:MAG: DNA-binding protein [Collimonas sp.]|uniref:helix-turn-helix transcriptional regulator n=1 Tax=Collimonas sp. TaxID=1963772 RepID=UPI0032652576